ncbi:MAG: DUF3887 domain-containing protein [Chloroflexota bacterium]
MSRTLLPLLLILSLLSACAPKETPITGADRDAVLAYSEPKTDNLLAGLNVGDYAAFSRDFDEAMLKAIVESDFASLKADRDEKLGAYLSREVTSVSSAGDFIVVVYAAKFEKEENVTVRVVFRAAEPHQISGLWFNK